MSALTDQLLEQLRRLTPEAADGYARIRAVVEADGALPASLKALLVAAGACARANAELAASEIERGRGLGLSEELIALALACLLLSRGETAGVRLIAAAGGLRESDPSLRPRPCSELDGVTYFKRYNDADELPPRMAQLQQSSQEVFDGYFAMHHACLSGDPRTDATAELIMCSLNTADLQPAFVEIHAGHARRRGVSDAELVEAAICAIPVTGVGAWAAAAAALFG